MSMVANVNFQIVKILGLSLPNLISVAALLNLDKTLSKFDVTF